MMQPKQWNCKISKHSWERKS